MTPKEKSRELVHKYYIHSLEGKACAIIAVDAILDELDHLPFDDQDFGTFKMKYWQEVKEEINKR